MYILTIEDIKNIAKRIFPQTHIYFNLSLLIVKYSGVLLDPTMLNSNLSIYYSLILMNSEKILTLIKSII